MDLHPDQSNLLEEAEVHIERLVEETGRFPFFALTLDQHANVSPLHLVDATDDMQDLLKLLRLILPLARGGQINASVICAPMSMDNANFAIFDLEHREAGRVLVTSQYGRDSSGRCMFGGREFKRDTPRMFGPAVDIRHAEFTFTLDGDWIRVSGSDPDQFTFESRVNRTSIVLSIMPIDVSQDRLIEVAKKLADARRRAERETHSGSNVKLEDARIHLRPSGDMAEIEYAGSDDASIFRFFGYVTRRKILSLWVSTSTTNNTLFNRAFRHIRDRPKLKRVLTQIHKGLKFSIP